MLDLARARGKSKLRPGISYDLAKLRRRLRSKSAGVLLLLLTLPLLLKTVLSLWSGDPGMLAASGSGWLLFAAAVWLCRRGVQAELRAPNRPLGARRGRLLKRAGGALVGVATAWTALFAAGHSLPLAAVFGLLATLGYFLLYGSEEAAKSEPAASSDDEAQALLRDAYRRVDSIERARQQLASGEFRQRLGHIIASVERILKLVSEDPRDLRRARKFLTVYLDGAQRVTAEYVRTHPGTASAVLEQNFRTLLVDMENTCEEQYGKLLQHDVTDLEVQIEVLSERLRREGVA